MNRIFKVVWSKAKHSYVVAPELAKTVTKGAAPSRSVRKAGVLAAAALILWGGAAVVPSVQADDPVTGPVIGSIETGTLPYEYYDPVSKQQVEEYVKNEATGTNAIVSGGAGNKASGDHSSVSGGINNKTNEGSQTGSYASVSGGTTNTASGDYSSVSGGFRNTASGESSSVLGGVTNVANGKYSTVSGGSNANRARTGDKEEEGSFTAGESSSISGGLSNRAAGKYASVSGGEVNDASGYDSSVSGGVRNMAAGMGSSVVGGSHNTAGDRNNPAKTAQDSKSGKLATVTGGQWNNAVGDSSLVAGGAQGTAIGESSVVLGGGYDPTPYKDDPNNNQETARNDSQRYVDKGEDAPISGKTEGKYSVSIGGGQTKTEAHNSVAIGNGAETDGAYAIAIGNGAKATKANTIAMGSAGTESVNVAAKTIEDTAGKSTITTNDYGTTFRNTDAQRPITRTIYQNGKSSQDNGTITNTTIKGNTISTGEVTADGLYDKSTQTDTGAGQVVQGDKTVGWNLNALDNRLAQIAQDRDAAVNRLNDRINKTNKEVDQVGAMSMAIAGLHPLSYDEGDAKFQLSAAVGTYDGTQALALGGFYHFNHDAMLSIGMTSDTDNFDKFGANIGYTRRIGQGGHKAILSDGQVSGILQDIQMLKDKLSAVESENQALKEKQAAQDAENRELRAELEALRK